MECYWLINSEPELPEVLEIASDHMYVGLICDNKKRLVVSCGELYLIYIWCEEEGVTFTVLKLNEEETNWEYVKGVGDDRIMFVTCDVCFFASSKDFPGWRGNCIVFLKVVFPNIMELQGMIREFSRGCQMPILSLLFFTLREVIGL